MPTSLTPKNYWSKFGTTCILLNSACKKLKINEIICGMTKISSEYYSQILINFTFDAALHTVRPYTYNSLMIKKIAINKKLGVKNFSIRALIK